MVNSRLFLETLPLVQRLARYRQLSQEALQKATDSGTDDMRAGYLSMAAGWHMLATEVERLRERQRNAQKSLSDADARDEKAPGETRDRSSFFAPRSGDTTQ
jgi:hypothetical protein